MYCQECGTDLGEGTAYCPGCGAAVGDGGGDRSDDTDRTATPAAEEPGEDPTVTWGAHEGEGTDGDDRVEDSRQARLPYPETTPPLLRGTVVGALAYGLGYLCVAGLVVAAGAIDPRSNLATLPVHSPDLPGAGWLFANAHNVGIVRHAGDQASPRVNLVEMVGESFPPVALYLLPPLVLVLVGASFGWWILSKRRDQRGWVTPKDGAVVGATLTTGYAVASVATTLTVFAVTTPTTAVGPALATAVLVMGVAYPLAFGTLGGALAGTVMGA